MNFAAPFGHEGSDPGSIHSAQGRQLRRIIGLDHRDARGDEPNQWGRSRRTVHHQDDLLATLQEFGQRCGPQILSLHLDDQGRGEGPLGPVPLVWREPLQGILHAFRLRKALDYGQLHRAGSSKCRPIFPKAEMTVPLRYPSRGTFAVNISSPAFFSLRSNS